MYRPVRHSGLRSRHILWVFLLQSTQVHRLCFSLRCSKPSHLASGHQLYGSYLPDHPDAVLSQAQIWQHVSIILPQQSRIGIQHGNHVQSCNMFSCITCLFFRDSHDCLQRAHLCIWTGAGVCAYDQVDGCGCCPHQAVVFLICSTYHLSQYMILKCMMTHEKWHIRSLLKLEIELTL